MRVKGHLLAWITSETVLNRGKYIITKTNLTAEVNNRGQYIITMTNLTAEVNLAVVSESKLIASSSSPSSPYNEERNIVTLLKGKHQIGSHLI